MSLCGKLALGALSIPSSAGGREDREAGEMGRGAGGGDGVRGEEKASWVKINVV